MAVRRIQYDETGTGGLNTGDGVGIDNIDNGGLGGGGYSGGSGGSGGGSGVTTNTYVFSIQVNEDTFSSFVNNSIQPTPKVVRITKESLAAGPKKIEVKKKGYVAQECYIISMIDDDVPIIDRPNGESPLGLNQKQIQVQKYIGDTLDGPARIIQSSTRDLIFTLNQATDDYNDEKIYDVKFNIGGSGTPVLISKNSKKNAEFFPIAGVSTYEDLGNTKYKITSSDLTLFRITDISITSYSGPLPSDAPLTKRQRRAFNSKKRRGVEPDPVIGKGETKRIEANLNESLELDITLVSNIEITVNVENVAQLQPELDPQIALVKTDPRKYNINSKAGAPLLIQKNEDVSAITIIVGDDILEFDELGDDDIIGLTIPHRVFKKIGQYNIKIFPFSMSDYEAEVNEVEEEFVEEKELVLTPKEKKKKVLKEEKVIIPEEKPEALFNPYSPVSDPIINDGRNARLDGRPNNEIRDKDINT